MDSYNSSQLKLLYTMEYFVLHTDEEHPANAKSIGTYLDARGLKVERKSVYRIIGALNQFGIHIEKTGSSFYYIPNKTDVFHKFAEKQTRKA